MSAPLAVPSPPSILRDYFRAKDENRPHLLEQVFAPDAELVVVNHSDAISFPARTVGREAIADVLVRNFCQVNENVYSFYLGHPPAQATTFSCAWLVTMTDRQRKSVRVGCGRYQWSFADRAPQLATHLTITIDAMQVLPPDLQGAVLAWVRALSYPWCSTQEATRLAPGIEPLAPVLQRLATLPHRDASLSGAGTTRRCHGE